MRLASRAEGQNQPAEIREVSSPSQITAYRPGMRSKTNTANTVCGLSSDPPNCTSEPLIIPNMKFRTDNLWVPG